MGAGDLDRQTDDRSAMDQLYAHGRDFSAAWDTQHTAIGAGEGGIGEGVLAQAFQQRYQRAEALKGSAAEVPDICFSCADVGHLCADDYLNANQAAGRGFDVLRDVG